MIELPRAALTADEIAEEAEFFSFGTNDLTQTTFGLSPRRRRQVPAPISDQGIFENDPFVSRSTRTASASWCGWRCEQGRTTRPDLKLGICGEHGGDPASIAFCDARRPRLRLLLALPRADRPAGGGAGGARGRRDRPHRLTDRRPLTRHGEGAFKAPSFRLPLGRGARTIREGGCASLRSRSRRTPRR